MLTALNVATATTTTYTGTTDETLIIANNASSSVTVWLPDATLMKGRIIVVTSTSSAVINNVTIRAVNSLVTGLGLLMINSATLTKHIFVSDGNHWY